MVVKSDQVGTDVENARAEIELDLKRVELDLKRQELAAQRLRGSWGTLTASPLTVAIAAGVLGLIGAGVSNFVQARSNLSLEREKFESSLILKAIETGDPEKAARNLLFLKNVGLIRDPSGRIAALAKTPTEAPVLPSQTTGVIPPTNYGTPLGQRSIKEVILHDTIGSMAGTVAMMKTPSLQASAHYVVGKNGETVRLLDENYIAFHAGSVARNNDSIGIELERLRLEDRYPDAQISALVSLLIDITHRHGIDPDEIHAHWEVDPRKTDGPSRDLLQQIRRDVRTGGK